MNKKIIYISEIWDDDILQLIVGKSYHMFNKFDVEKNYSKSPSDQHIIANIISDNLIDILRDKKIKNLVYMLYGSSEPQSVKEFFKINVLSKIQQETEFEIKFILDEPSDYISEDIIGVGSCSLLSEKPSFKNWVYENVQFLEFDDFMVKLSTIYKKEFDEYLSKLNFGFNNRSSNNKS